MRISFAEKYKNLKSKQQLVHVKIPIIQLAKVTWSASSFTFSSKFITYLKWFACNVYKRWSQFNVKYSLFFKRNILIQEKIYIY